MEHTGLIAVDAPSTPMGYAQMAYADAAAGMSGVATPFASLNIERSSEARRFLFAAAHHGTRADAPLSSFPGKFAWIAVVLFVLSVLIAVIG